MNRIVMTGIAPKTVRSGFTLVEILVVISIVGLVAAITLPAIGQAIARARNAAIKTEIDMLHMAMMAYRNEYGSFPPAITTFSTTDWGAKHLTRIFPRMTLVSATQQLPSIAYMNAGAPPSLTNINPASALPAWLYGYNGNPTLPIFYSTASGTAARQKLYDFDTTRISGTSGSFQVFYAPNKPGSPYVYINSTLYTTGSWPASAATYQVASSSGTTTYTINANTYYAHRVPLSSAPSVFNNAAQPAFNPDTFQILSAGRDETFGTDDDLSNFWPGTRQDYIDSLNN